MTACVRGESIHLSLGCELFENCLGEGFDY